MLIMTFNLRFENDRDGENNWSNRRATVIEVIERYRPALLGTQEGTRAQLSYLREHLSGYGLFAPQRFWDETCQYPSLFYRTGELVPLEGGDHWLSETPGVHRSIGWDSAFPRMMSCGRFEDVRSGQKVWAVVTHLDNMGAVARIEQARIIAQWIARCGGPCILAGDFNDSPGSTVHQMLLAPETGLRDTWEVLKKKEDELSMTYHKFSGAPMVCRMAWVLASRSFEPVEAVIVRDRGIDGHYPSDHFPYLVRLSWK